MKATEPSTPAELEADESAAKRAQWESFAFVVPTTGRVDPEPECEY